MKMDIFISMKILLSEKQAKKINKKELDEVSNSAYSLAEKIYRMVKDTPFHDKEKMISKIAKMIER